MEKIDLKSSKKYHTFFPAWLNMVNTTAADYAVDKGIGASRYNVGIISAMASQITNLTIVI